MPEPVPVPSAPALALSLPSATLCQGLAVEAGGTSGGNAQG